MIPKKIHYCWFGKNPLSLTAIKCIETWKTVLPDYEIKIWDETNCPMDHPFIVDAYNAKKYAFVADYVRLWVLYNEGGIYLDTDMYVLKSFNNLLQNKSFFGYEEPDNRFISAGIIGSVKGDMFIYKILEIYNNLKFIENNIDSLKIPLIITNVYLNYDIKDEIKIYPFDFFYPFPFKNRNDKKNFLIYKTQNTYAIHLWDRSWVTWKIYFKRKLNRIIFRINNMLNI